MSAFVFKISCPRCETAINIFLGKDEFLCSRCEFQVLIEDKEGLLPAFKSGQESDLEFSEEPIKGSMGGMDTGLRLKFSRNTQEGEVAPASESHAVIDDAMREDLILDNKTANTQVIQLTFDPSKYLDKIQEEHKSHSSGKKTRRKKISLSKVIKYAEKAKPAVPSKNEKMVRLAVYAFLIILVIVVVAFLASGVK